MAHPLLEPEPQEEWVRHRSTPRSRLLCWAVVAAFIVVSEFRSASVSLRDVAIDCLILLLLAVTLVSARVGIRLGAVALLVIAFGTDSDGGHWAVNLSLAGVAVLMVVTPRSLLGSDVGRVLWPGWHLQRERRRLVALGRCASCGWDLADIMPAGDGCTQCERCGAAWRLPRSEPEQRPGRCFRCGYSLAGLPVAPDGSVRCPECALQMPERAEAEEPIDPPSEAPATGPRCWGCGRSLRGLEIRYGDRVRCPDCGQWRSGLTAGDVGEPTEPHG